MRKVTRLGVLVALVLANTTALRASAAVPLSAMAQSAPEQAKGQRGAINDEEARRPGGVIAPANRRQAINEEVKTSQERDWLHSIWTLP